MNPDREFGPLQPPLRVAVAFLACLLIVLAVQGQWVILGIQLVVLVAGVAIGAYRGLKS